MNALYSKFWMIYEHPIFPKLHLYNHIPHTLHLDQLWPSVVFQPLSGALWSRHSGERYTPCCWWSLLDAQAFYIV